MKYKPLCRGSDIEYRLDSFGVFWLRVWGIPKKQLEEAGIPGRSISFYFSPRERRALKEKAGMSDSFEEVLADLDPRRTRARMNRALLKEKKPGHRESRVVALRVLDGLAIGRSRLTGAARERMRGAVKNARHKVVKTVRRRKTKEWRW